MSPGPTDFAGMPPLWSVPEPTYRRSYLRLVQDGLGDRDGGDPVTILREALRGEAQEVVMVAAVDGLGNVVELVEIARGGYHSVVVPLPPLLAVPLLAGCDRAVIAHTHPSGRLIPSEHDYAMTKTVADGLNACGVILRDHLIFGPDGKYLSLREAHVLEVPEPTIVEVQA